MSLLSSFFVASSLPLLRMAPPTPSCRCFLDFSAVDSTFSWKSLDLSLQTSVMLLKAVMTRSLRSTFFAASGRVFLAASSSVVFFPMHFLSNCCDSD